MDRRAAIDHLNGIRPKLSRESNKALDVVIAEAEYAESMETRPVYYCDAKNNTVCPKHACHLRGGVCRLTSNPEYAIYQGGQPLRAPFW